MITIECVKCGKKRHLDDGDEDEIHNAFFEGWDFSLWLDTETICPSCKLNKELETEDELGL